MRLSLGWYGAEEGTGNIERNNSKKQEKNEGGRR
jgi:hypothetical protein